MGLLIFFLVAFTAAFTVIKADRRGFETLSRSLLTVIILAMGEFDFKETFLGDFYIHQTFYTLQMFLLVVFVVVMPIIIMNIILALAIDDTSTIMQQAKLQSFIQTVSILYDT